MKITYSKKNGDEVKNRAPKKSGSDIVSDIKSPETTIKRMLREACEKKLRGFFDNSNDAIFVADPTYDRLVDCNNKAQKLVGFTKTEILGMRASNLHPADRARETRGNFKKQMKGRAGFIETEVLKKTGERIPVEVNAGIIKIAQKKYFLGIFRNISERKQAEETLEKKDKFIESLLQNSALATFVVDSQHKVIYWNKACEKLTGMKARDLLGTSDHWKAFYDHRRPCVADIVIDNASGDMANLYEVWEKSALNPDGLHAEGWYPKLGGKKRYVAFDAAPAYDANGKLIAAIETLQDITKRKQTENDLVKSEARYRFLIELTGQLTWIANGAGEVVEDIPIWRKFTGLSYGKTKGMGWARAIHPLDAERTKQAWEKAVKDRSTYEVEYRIRRSDGVYRNFLTRGIPVTKEDGSIQEWMGVSIDITERKKADIKIHESESLYRQLIETTDTGYVTVDVKGRVIDANSKYIQLTGHRGLDEIQGRNLIEWTAEYEKEKNAKAIEECFQKGYIRNLEIDYAGPDGGITPVEINATVVEKNRVHIILALCRDTTDRRQREEKIRIFSHAINSASDIFFLTDIKGNITYANTSAARAFGYTAEEFLRLNVAALDADPEAGKKTMQALATKGKWSAEVVNIRKDKEKFSCLLSAFTVKDEHGKPKGTMGILKDISERKRAEETLRISENKYKQLFEESNDAIFIADPKTKMIIDCNKKAEKLSGYSRQEIVSMQASQLHPEDKIIETMQGFEDQARGVKENIESEILTKDGRRVSVSISSSTVDIAGKPCLMGLFRDITGLKKAENALRGEKNKLEKYLDVAGAIIVFLGFDGKVRLINRFGRETLGYENIDIFNKNWVDEFILEKDRIKTAAIFASLIKEKTDQVKYFETALLAKSGRLVNVNWGSAVIRDGSGEIEAILNIGINTTELAEAKIAIDQLKELNKLKDDFLNISTHELKTPLTSIIGFGGLLKDQGHFLNSEQEKYINIINSESARLNNIIKRILTITRLESGREIISFESFDLSAFIQSLQPSLDMLLMNKPAKLAINAGKEIVITSNKEKISELIYNFFDNALKYGDNDQIIAISVTRPDKERVKIAVKDHGPGIPPKGIEKLFKKFSQLEPSLTRSQEGTGLGLYICKLIVDNLGGKIGVESILGEGSTFYFTLPIEQPPTGIPIKKSN